MKNVIIGTAGHVDHGKTLLTQALTGIWTDRLSEEKKRGITIELGFAHIDFDDGLRAGIVDVPGHEKFIKNMLAGAGGIDLCMLAVAADEGFMPQTIEHLNILTLLGVKDGLIVLTKKDLVDDEWLEMMKEECASRAKGTFLEGKPIVAVSAQTNEGIDTLRECLHDMVIKAGEKSTRIPFRLPIDRVFSIDGFGTVVTGTLVEGCMNVGDAAQLVPSDAQTRVRNLQVHGTDVQTAYAGQRVAVNLANLKRTDIKRGDAVVRPGSVRVSSLLDVKLRNLADSGRIINNGTQLHLYHSAAVVLCKVVLLDCDTLEPGESCYAQLRTDEPVASKNGDRFVIRFYSPLETIGGGVILDDAPEKHKRKREDVINALKIKESGSLGEKITQCAAEFSTLLVSVEQLCAKLALTNDEVEAEVQELVDHGRMVMPLEGKYAAASVIDALWENCRVVLEAYHKKNSLHVGMKAAELRQKLFKNVDQTTADALLTELVSEGRIARKGERYALSDFEVHFTKRQSAIREKLLCYYAGAGIEPMTVDEVFRTFEEKERADCKQVLDGLLSSGDIIMLGSQICYNKEAFQTAYDALNAHFATHDTITLAEMRDALSTSRKYALAILEYTDANRITRKDGDLRRKC